MLLGLILKDEFMAIIAELYKLIEQTEAEHRANKTSLIANENEPGSIGDGDSCTRRYWKRVVFLGIVQNLFMP